MGPSREWGRQTVTKPHREVPGKPLERRDGDVADFLLLQASRGDRDSERGQPALPLGGGLVAAEAGITRTSAGLLSAGCSVWKSPREPAHQLSPSLSSLRPWHLWGRVPLPGPLGLCPQGSSLSHLFELVLPSLLVQGSRHLPLMLSLKPTQDFLPLHALCAFLAPNNN